MKAAVVLKAQNGAIRTFEGNRITLEAPSVVQLQVGPEQVARFERKGNDLLLVLEDGTALVIENFFVKTADERNDLVFEDGSGVTWWAQYGDDWTGFDIAEINDDVMAVPLPPVPLSPALLAGFGLLAGGAALAGSGSGSSSSTPTNTPPNTPPVVTPERETTSEDTPVRGNVLTNDSDPDGDPLAVTSFEVGGTSYAPGETATIPGVGTITFGSDGSYVFTPVADWNATVPTVTYTVSDGKGGSITSTLDIEVTPVNDIVPDEVTTHAGDPVTTRVLDNDSFENEDAAITAVTQGGHGTVTINPDGTITYTPDDGYVGPDSYTYTVMSGGRTETTTVTVTVENAPPVVMPERETTLEDTPIRGTVLANDSDPDGDPLAVTSFEVGGTSYAPGQTATILGVGTITLGSDGSYVFTPVADWNGTVPTITYTVSDGEGGSTTSTLNIEVTPVDDTPVAIDPIVDQANEDAQGITPLDVSTYFSDPDGDTLTYSASNLPEGLSIDPVTGIISGTINHSASQDGASGVYSVTVTATDGGGLSVDRTFTWTVTNPSPIANDDTTITDVNTAVTGNVITAGGSGDVADADPDGDSLSVTSFMIAGNATPHNPGDSVLIAGVGTFTLGSTGAYSFTPVADWNGTVPTITYTISDAEGGTDTANLVITVALINDAPEANGTISIQANEDAQGITPLDVSTYFSDPDGDTLTYSASNLPEGLSIDPVTGIISGTINHSASQDGASGVYSVTVTATDGGGLSVDRTFTWTVTNPSPIANDDTTITNEDTAVTGNVITAGGSGDVADADPDGDSLSVTSFMIAGNATPHNPGDSVLIAGVGTFTLGSTGAYSFTPVADWNGTVPTITYTISDAEGGTDTANLVITVTPVNDGPVITGGDQSGAVIEEGNLDNGVVVAGKPSATGSFTATDVESDALTWTVVGTPDATYGAFSINPATGAWTYTLDNTLPATQALNEGDSVPLTYSVQVNDGAGGTATRTITITITGTNDSPVANADVGVATEEGVEDGGNTAAAGIPSATGNVLTNDTDVDDGEKATLTVSGVNFGGSVGAIGSALTGTYGSLVLNGNGTYTYTLNNGDADTQALKQGQSGTEVFTYTVVDANGATSTSTLTITLTGTNDRPVITSTFADATGEVIEQGTANPAAPNTVSGTLTASDVDVGATQTWSIVNTNNGTYGTIGIDPVTGRWTYTLDNTRSATQTLNDGETRTETFTARVTDEHGAYRDEVITVTVRGSNDDLAGSGDETVPLAEDGSTSGTLQDYVSDPDDVIKLTSLSVDSDGDGTDESYAPGATVTLRDGLGNELGTLIIEENGAYSFTPASHYAGDVPTVTYTMTEANGSKAVTQTLDFEIIKVADAPRFEADKTVNTNEDTAITLDLKAPEITDTGTGTSNNDHPERLGEITLTIGGAGASGVTLSTGGTVLTPVDGKITIVLTDVAHVTSVPGEDNANGVYHLTKAQYEALRAHPAAESGRDFTVTVSATSYEVDAGGVIIPGVDGATSTQVIDVDVQAVTDGATLTSSQTSLTFAEDTSLDLSGYLAAVRNDGEGNGSTDADGSEDYWYTITGLPANTVVSINGAEYTASAAGTVTSAVSSTFTAAPSITITPPADFSGDMASVTLTLNSRDTDSDSTGTPATISSPVILNLHVAPVAGDVSVNDVTTPEDTAVAFLAGVTVTDTGVGATGSEVIDLVSFEVPAGWVVTPPDPSSGWTYGLIGSTATITFDNTLSEAAREAILDAFTIKPPAHGSGDKTITLSITSTDSNTVKGTSTSDTKTVERDVEITVTPDAEQVGGDSADTSNNNDVAMNSNHAYLTDAGKEDSWFALGTNYTDASNIGGGNAQLKAPWSNADADEFTYAVLTPTLASDTPSDTVIGTQFRYSTDGGATWETRTFVGEPIWVPAVYLDSLQVKLPADVSGMLTIGVKAGTVDYDDDTDVATLPLDPPHTSGPGVNVDVTGSATLSSIKFSPVADAVTMALNGRAPGLEDNAIPLSIKTTSSDASETFNVTISGIPVGATITYGMGSSAVTFTASAGNSSFEISNFSNTTPLTITPPLNSNDDFTLTVSAVSVDGTDTSDPVASRTIDVSVTGVADAVVVTLPALPYTATEASLDSGGRKVALSDLVAGVVSSDNDDSSETITLRITGLAEGFSVTGATAVVSGTGTERVWLVSGSNLSNVSITVPENYSGTANLKVVGVTTENDGNSFTGVPTDVSFTVTPSPEATITTSATLIEDEVTLLNLAIAHQNGDGNETLGKIYVPVDYDTSTYTLYLGASELSAAGLGTTTIGGVPYYVIPADQVDELGARGTLNKDGDLGSLNFLYEVTDTPSDGTLASETAIKPGTLALAATPVTDLVQASITGITMTSATGTAANDIQDDDAEPDTATVTGSGTVTVNLHVNSADTDGSEHLIRVLIDGVPDGVTVNGASHIGAGSWVLVYDGSAAISIGSRGINVPVEFVLGVGAGDGTSAITMTVQAQDGSQSAATPAAIETDSVRWNLVLDLADGAPYPPPVIDEWSYNGTSGTEDTTFTLDSVIDAAVTTGDPSVPYSYTVTITDLPAGTTVTGMILTTVDGVPTWTAKVTVPANGDSQAALDDLLSNITITPPANSNDNNADFSFDAKLTAAAVGGTSVEADTTTDMPVIPVSDEATMTVATRDAGEGEISVTATITALNLADGADGRIVNGKLYVQVSSLANDGGTVTDGNGQTFTLTPVSGIDGVPDGNYYVIDVGDAGGSVELTYTAPDGTMLKSGDVTFSAWAQTQETDAANTESASASGTANIEIANNGVTVESQPTAGREAASSDKSNAIELSGLSVALNDNDGSETIRSIMLSGVPVGFLLYVGDTAGDATLLTQASNAGGDGTTNTWVLSTDGTLPAYVAILPATNWSGTLDDLLLVVESGENSLSPTRVDTVPLGPVTVDPFANGLTIDPTLSFGTEGRVIDLNLNAAMDDPTAATAAVVDGSTETTTLQITGLGEHAAFYVGDELITSVSYDEDTGTYTITGLLQDELDDLGVMQAASALTDQDAAAAGTQVNVTAWTVESSNSAQSALVSNTLTLSVTPVLATTGNDSFIWGGRVVDGLSGDDTVRLRQGESLTGAQLEAHLTNVETLDLGIVGGNSITDLTPEQVEAMTDGRKYLTIRGAVEDSVSLSGDWNDNGDGTYTGTIAGSSGVTLAFEGDVMVTPPAAGAAATSMMPIGAFGEMEGFGLASLSTHETPTPDAPKSDPVSIDEVLSSDTRGEDLTAVLPEEHHDGPAPFEVTAGETDFVELGGPVHRPPLEDELRSSVHYEV
ncbi:tandem-95 repeat protein [Microvirga sp. 3-52]|nr:tandem-95 repeat protein [Microvirga sp. 3-52]